MNNKIVKNTNDIFGELTTIIKDDGTVLFKANDILRSLGYSEGNWRSTLSRKCRCVSKCNVPHPQNQNKEITMNFIPEGDVYRLIVSSKLPSAENFELWVFAEVLPSIRKHGAYMTNDVIERTLTDPDYLIQLATALKEERQARQLAEQTIEKQKPLVDFANQVSDTTDLIDMKTMAKLLKDKNINIGRNRLFEFIRMK